MPVGIVCEYNPFHNGHCYQLEAACKAAEAAGISDSRIICVMSGHFVQRSAPAAADKFARAEMALRQGASLVIELPTYYSTATAEWFARGSVCLLAGTGLLSALSFGIEDPSSLSLLGNAAALLAPESEDYLSLLHRYLAEGQPYAAARTSALNDLLPEPLPTGSNQILALEYMKALRLLDYDCLLLPIARKGADHDSPASSDASVLSASRIRSLWAQGISPEPYVPASTLALLPPSPITEEALFPALRYVLATHTPDTLRNIDEVSEGLENRILDIAAGLSSSGEDSGFGQLANLIHSKRYPLSRIRRILLNTVLDITTEKKEALSFEKGPSYLRILGVAAGSEDLLSQMADKASLPLLIRPADMDKLSPSGRLLWEEEQRFSRIYHTLNEKAPVSDFTRGLIRV